VLIYEQMAAPNAYIPAKLLSTDSLTVRLVLIRPVLWMRPRGLAVHGDVDIVPAGTPSRWEIMHDDTASSSESNPQFSLRSLKNTESCLRARKS
jgi:hypothetical protein